MKHLPTGARFYLSTVILSGGVALLVCLPRATYRQPILLLALMALAAGTPATRISLPLGTNGATMSLSSAVEFMSLLLLGPHATLLVALMTGLGQGHLNRHQPGASSKTLFNTASLVLTVEGAGLAYRLLGGTGPSMALDAMLLPVAGAAAVYFLLSTLLGAADVALSARQSIASTWHREFLWSAPSYFVGAGAAALSAALVVRAGYWVAPLALAPLYMTYRTYKVYMARLADEQAHARETSNLHLATIEALARAIDAKDRTTQMHIRRMQVYAAGLAQAAGLAPGDVQAVKTAALLHDIGKLAVPEHILTKPGPLTQEEFQKIRMHPQVGAEIIAGVRFPYPVAPLILSHHERWDGKGYPDGLTGEQIPLGARIISVVDYFDAVSTERPYHKAVSRETAVGLLKREAGHALDPRLVPLFIEILPRLVEDLAKEQRRAAQSVDARTAEVENVHGVQPETLGNALENIALAHREIYALYQIAQSMGTSIGVAETMELISSKLIKIVPWSSCALFLHQPELGSLACRFSEGLESTKLQKAVLRVGSDLTGAVTRDRRTLVNVDPRLVFDAAGIPGDTRLRSAMLCPLLYDSVFVGCLALFHADPWRYNDDHRRLLERVAEQAGAVIHNSIVFEQTQEDSLTDPLTGLPNRRSLCLHLTRELARAERRQTDVAVVVLDIDGLKTINDTYGHQVGDEALRAVSGTLRAALRPYNLSVRFAGDEFVVVLDDCPPESAEEKRCELQMAIARIALECRPGETLTLAASAGAAVFPHDGATYEALLAEADRRMYRDKQARRAGAGRGPAARSARGRVSADVVRAGEILPRPNPTTLA